MPSTPPPDSSDPFDANSPELAPLDLNPDQPGVKRLSPRMIALLGGLGLLIFTVAFVYGFGGRNSQRSATPPPPAFTPASDNVIDSALTRLPEDYRFDAQDYPPPPENPELPQASEAESLGTDPAITELRRRQLESLRQQLEEAMDSPVVFRGVETRRHERALSAPDESRQGQHASTASPDPKPQTLTDDGFLARRGSGVSAGLTEPASPYEIKAGTILPGALLTGIHSDLPGVITGQVTEHVYDTVSGTHLLIPQGSRLVGRYSSLIGTGQNRVMIAWDRIMLPNGDSLELPTVPGADALGRSGLTDRVDYHLGRIGLATVLSTAIAFASDLGRDTDSENDVVGETVAQQASQLGQRIIDRELDLPPTVTVRPGTRFNVLVNQDLVLRPYSTSGR